MTLGEAVLEQRVTELERQVDQLGFSLAQSRSNERALKATVTELQDTIARLCHDDVQISARKGA